MKLWPGDLIVDHSGNAESQDGIMLAISRTLILESLECFAQPCQIHRLHRRGLQCQQFADRIHTRKPREFELYRLALWHRFTANEAELFEEVAKGMVRNLPPLRAIPSAVAIAGLLIRFEKLSFHNPKYITVSVLIRELIESGMYEHIGSPQFAEGVSLHAAEPAA